MTFYRDVKKTAKKATKAVGKRYGVSYGRRGLRMTKHSIPKMLKDIEMVKSRLNVEKKLKVGLVQTGNVGQFDGNSAGFQTHDITPLWTQGVGEEQRVGNSLKLTGYHMKVQFRGQTSQFNGRRIKMMIVKTTRPGTIPLANIVEDMFDVNPLTNIVDYHSDRDYSDNQKTEKIITVKNLYLPKPVHFVNDVAQNGLCDATVSLKLSDVLRFENNLTSAPNDVRYFVVIMTDTGNMSSSASCTNNGCMVQATNSGLEYQFHDKFWYVDN